MVLQEDRWRREVYKARRFLSEKDNISSCNNLISFDLLVFFIYHHFSYFIQ